MVSERCVNCGSVSARPLCAPCEQDLLIEREGLRRTSTGVVVERVVGVSGSTPDAENILARDRCSN